MNSFLHKLSFFIFASLLALSSMHVHATALKFTQIDAGYEHTCGITEISEAYCWGKNDAGEIGAASQSSRIYHATEVSQGFKWTHISAGRSISCGVTSTKDAYCWGNNTFGQLGTGDTEPSSSPRLVSGSHKWKSIEAGYFNVCGITIDNNAFCWGQAGDSLGSGKNPSKQTTPKLVSGNYKWSAIDLNIHPTPTVCGITQGGGAYCWGNGLTYQFLNGKSMNSSVPHQISNSQKFKALLVGTTITCGLTSEDYYLCAGTSTINGQLGTGATPIHQVEPVAIPDSHKWMKLSLGQKHSCAVTNKQEGICWGEGTGQLGEADEADFGKIKPSPVKVTDNVKWEDISAGSGHSCGISIEGIAYCWGRNSYGQLGVGDNSLRLTFSPEKVTKK